MKNNLLRAVAIILLSIHSIFALEDVINISQATSNGALESKNDNKDQDFFPSIEDKKLRNKKLYEQIENAKKALSKEQMQYLRDAKGLLKEIAALVGNCECENVLWDQSKAVFWDTDLSCLNLCLDCPDQLLSPYELFFVLRDAGIEESQFIFNHYKDLKELTRVQELSQAWEKIYQKLHLLIKQMSERAIYLENWIPIDMLNSIKPRVLWKKNFWNAVVKAGLSDKEILKDYNDVLVSCDNAISVTARSCVGIPTYDECDQALEYLVNAGTVLVDEARTKYLLGTEEIWCLEVQEVFGKINNYASYIDGIRWPIPTEEQIKKMFLSFSKILAISRKIGDRIPGLTLSSKTLDKMGEIIVALRKSRLKRPVEVQA